MNLSIKHRLEEAGLFQTPGAYVLVDGQYGSTGKGLAASFLAELFHDKVDAVTTNAGPNSGHTSYFGDEKIVLRQLPTFGVIAHRMGSEPTVAMNHGAIIDPKILNEEAAKYIRNPFSLFVSPNAAVVDDTAKGAEAHLVSSIGSTGKGTGAALARKVMRNPDGVAGSDANKGLIDAMQANLTYQPDKTYFIEVSQGFSLSLNGGFYPYTTSRDCTVAGALADAWVHPSMYRQSIMVVRTYPIRVAGNSGDTYPDQCEMTWGVLGQEPELTTVTQKVRRVFSWSSQQYRAALLANRPDYIFCNFMQYLPEGTHRDFLRYEIVDKYERTLGYKPKAVLLGYGPKNEDVSMWEEV